MHVSRTTLCLNVVIFLHLFVEVNQNNRSGGSDTFEDQTDDHKLVFLPSGDFGELTFAINCFVFIL